MLRASAKVNLALEVLGKRGDGYHEIATVLQAVDLFDRLTVETADTLSLHADDPELPTDEGNLVMRAARLLQKTAGIEKGAANPRTDKAGQVTSAQVKQIAETKMPDLNAIDLDGAIAQVAGTARSMGIEISG